VLPRFITLISKPGFFCVLNFGFTIILRNMLIQYVGEQERYSIHKPHKCTFDPFVPTPIPDGLYQFLDKRLFKPVTRLPKIQGRPVQISLGHSLWEKGSWKAVAHHVQSFFPCNELVIGNVKDPYRDIQWSLNSSIPPISYIIKPLHNIFLEMNYLLS